MGPATETQTRDDADGDLNHNPPIQPRTQYSSAPSLIPPNPTVYATFEGYFIPDSSSTKVAIFSDDGVDVYINGTRVLNKKDIGQHLPNLTQSFQVLTSSFTQGQSYHVKVEYSQVCYLGSYDIDGCTMYAYDGGGSIYDWSVDIDTDSNNDGSINSTDDPIEETSPGKYVSLNTDDDNANGIPDKDDTGSVTGENDLAQVNLAYSPTSGINGAKITLVASSGSSKIKAWNSSTKGTEITISESGTTYVIGTNEVPTTIYVEGIDAGEAMLDMVMKNSGNQEVCRDKVLFTVRDNLPSGSTCVYDLGLPTSDLNNIAGPDRCNIRWSDSSTDIGYGDIFSLTANKVIDRVRVWIVPDMPVLPAYNLGDYFQSITLYTATVTGSPPDALTARMTGTFVTGTCGTDNANITCIRTQYDNANEKDYQGADGTYHQIWQVDFNNLNWSVSGGAYYVFGVLAVPRIDRQCFIHATYWASQGDGYIRQYDSTNLSGGSATVSGADWFGKGSDINVQVFAHPQ
ncbi:MAG: PA14 domain-containing protein [Armatimonadetes bacterium]|nr:PA14 domain-containing protein [Armatimonadota bacterium]